MFPSWPIRVQLPLTEGSSKSREESSNDESGSVVKTLSSTTQPDDHDHDRDDDQGLFLELDSSQDDPMTISISVAQDQVSRFRYLHHQQQQQQPGTMASNSSRAEASSQYQSPLNNPPQLKRQDGTKGEKVLDTKRQRRLAQNREAARKSRLRKKAYLQQLESSRMKLAQLELDLQRARSQGLLFGGASGASANINSGGATFDMEYGRWVEDDQRLMLQLRAALQFHISEPDLGAIFDGYINHYNELFRLKEEAAKSDIFHLLTGVWSSPAERCFLWIAGFRPSELLKMLIGQLEPLTEQQLMGICSLQQSCQQAEEALSQGLDQLQQSLVHIIAPTTDVTSDPMHQMAVALAELSNLEGFVRQADNLRRQTLNQLRRTLTVRQAARCFLMIGEYYGRLRALSSLWASCPRDQATMNEKNAFQAPPDLHMVQPPQNHFPF